MTLLKYLVAVLALSEAGWMLFDGSRALIAGDYVTPKSGSAGRLRPWASLVSAVGIEPRSTTMKCVFVVYGLLWMGAIAVFLLDFAHGWLLMVVAAAGSLWYLPIGTALGVVQLVLLLVLKK